ncbi:glycosyltransferase [Candidatus Woesearchaeota archaeon]|nr:glycosyltransferase [Candidatus Woesearchaeota archaeon]
MRICYLANAAETHTLRWVEHFSKEHEVILITNRIVRSWYRELVSSGSLELHVVKAPKNPALRFITTLFAVRRLIRRLRPDIVHAHYVSEYGVFAAFSGFRPFMVSPWGGDIQFECDRLFGLWRLMVRHVIRTADLVQAPDPTIAKYLMAFSDRGNVRVLKWMGVKTDLFRPRTRSTGKTVRIIHLRRLAAEYSNDVLFRALAMLEQRGVRGFSVTYLDFGVDRERMRALIRKLGIAPLLKPADWIPYAELPSVLAAHDIYVDTFRAELPGAGIGMGCMEAMGCGCAAVFADIPGARVYLTDGKNAVLYAPGDPASLADALGRLVRDARLRKRVARAARAYILAKQDWDTNMAEVERAYEGLLAERR